MFNPIKKYKKQKEEKHKITQKDRFNSALSNFEVNQIVNGDFEGFMTQFRDHSLIMLIVGRRGAGKTALGMKLVETAAILDKNIFVIGFNNSKIPYWVQNVESISEIPNNSLVLIDEAGISFSSRSSMKQSNKDLAELLAIARHKNLSLIFITQNSAMLDLNVLRLCDILLFKEPSLLQTRFERKALQDMFIKVGNSFSEIKNKKEHFYVISDEFEGLMKAGLPEFWNDSISKSFRKK
ncbi:AAA family ATPase [Candidatus Woesearchaeota archaeon]|jgi:hypothetical protein|nr:AAA family ATPase [Candidatus Woesearchaeota archaeon]MBT6995329.1 AAA family ATPase [Candidatus Woesearchaeota archaeon]MBT7238048.1 AAA family ATPase [Candidatus Woesearchaeota archaeon]